MFFRFEKIRLIFLILKLKRKDRYKLVIFKSCVIYWFIDLKVFCRVGGGIFVDY